MGSGGGAALAEAKQEVAGLREKLSAAEARVETLVAVEKELRGAMIAVVDELNERTRAAEDRVKKADGEGARARARPMPPPSSTHPHPLIQHPPTPLTPPTARADAAERRAETAELRSDEAMRLASGIRQDERRRRASQGNALPHLAPAQQSPFPTSPFPSAPTTPVAAATPVVALAPLGPSPSAAQLVAAEFVRSAADGAMRRVASGLPVTQSAHVRFAPVQPPEPLYSPAHTPTGAPPSFGN